MIIRIRMYYEGATVEAIMENRRKIEEDLTMFSGFWGRISIGVLVKEMTKII